MKKFLAIVILSLSLTTPSQSDDVSDFEIEGMSIGDSLLEYLSEKEIINNIRDYGYPNHGFYATGFSGASLKIYDSIDVHLKKNDKKYIIYSLDAINFYKDMNDCYKKMNEVEIELSQIFSDSKKDDLGIRKHDGDKSGKSTVKSMAWYLNTGDFVSIECYYWSKQIKKKYPWGDHLRIALTTKELDDWLNKIN